MISSCCEILLGSDLQVKMQLDWIVDKIDNIPPISLTIALVAITATIAYYVKNQRGLPPGPIGVPILGYFPFLPAQNGHLHLDKLKKKYGDVFSFRIIGQMYITLGSMRTLREAHHTKADCFNSRPQEYSLFHHLFGDGIAFLNGDRWKVLRKYFLLVLKERGMATAKNNMTEALYDSIKETIKHLETKNGELENISQLLTDKCTQILRHTLFGNNVMENELREISENFGGAGACLTTGTVLLNGRIAKLLFKLNPSVRKSMESHKRLVSLIYKIIDDHKSSYDEQNTRDLIDDYFKERDIRLKRGDPTAQYFTDKALMGSLIQFIGDGILSMATFLGHFLKFTAEYPEEQEKIYQELMEVVGPDRQPTIEDKSKLKYMNAFIQESLRHSDFFPFTPSQVCTKETTVGGFRIPVGAVTIMNSWSCHFDPETYEEPEKFNPSRFIGIEGKKRPELPVNFGLGRRSCMGEGFAMTQVFLFLATIIQNFRLTIPKSMGKISFEFQISEDLQICAHLRDKK